MSPLRFQTRRRICRTIFVVAGILPLAAVLGAGALVNSDVYQTGIRDQLQATLGLGVEAAKISYPCPGDIRLDGLKVIDPETSRTIAEIRSIQASRDGRNIVLTASVVDLDAACADQLWTVALRQLRRHLGDDQASWRLIADEVIFHWPGNHQPLKDLSVQLKSAHEANSLSAAFRFANDTTAQPISFIAEHHVDQGHSWINWQLDTAGSTIPCSLATALAHIENHLGPQSVCRGKIWGIDSENGWQAQLAGQLEAIDLQSAFGTPFGYRLEGLAKVGISQAVVHDGRLEAFVGQVRSGPGKISTALLNSAVEFLGMRRAIAESQTSGLRSFDELAADFTLDAGGLSIRGACGKTRSGTVIQSGSSALLSESTVGVLSPVALVRMLVPDNRIQVPATRQTDWLLHILPLPDAPAQAGVR
jgi:hypothetical protein